MPCSNPCHGLRRSHYRTASDVKTSALEINCAFEQLNTLQINDYRTVVGRTAPPTCRSVPIVVTSENLRKWIVGDRK